MITNFENISSENFEKLRSAIAKITVYIAGADNNIDVEETAWAGKLTDIRSYAGPDILNEFYTKVGEDFSDVLTNMIKDLPSDNALRAKQLSNDIAELNPILASLSNEVGAAMYKSYTSFAKHVAKASGGFLGFGSISREEKKLIGLDMLNEIVLIEE